MRLGVLFSGGKDSTLALFYAQKHAEVVCLITLESENKESYMFHTPAIELAGLQAEALGLPIIIQKTKGEKEEELKDLKAALKAAKTQYKIEGIVTGAVESVYQASRIQRLALELSLTCFSPLWQKPQLQILEELESLGFEVMITGVYGQGMEEFFCRRIDKGFITEIKAAAEQLKLNLAGEGGEYESLVLFGPNFQKRLVILKSHPIGPPISRTLVVDKVSLR
jgi:diphthine-ammonia ligase